MFGTLSSHTGVSLSSWKTASGGPSTDQPMKGHQPVNVNNTSSRVRLNRLPTTILHLPLSRFPHSPYIHCANYPHNTYPHTHTPALPFISPCTHCFLSSRRSLSSHHSFSTSFPFPPRVLLAHRALVSSTTYLLYNHMCVCFSAGLCMCFWEEGEVLWKTTSRITLLFLSMFSHSTMRGWVGSENVLPPVTHTHANTHTQWDIQYVEGTSCH